MAGEDSSVGKASAAVMFADVTSYSRLMGINQEHALRAVKEVFSLTEPCVNSHGGSVIKTIGDAFMARFPSGDEALACAVEFQGRCRAAAIQGPEGHVIQLRVGIHVGEVLESKGDIFGDAVNIAARLEGKAKPGGIVLSGDAFRALGPGRQQQLAPLGPLNLKNIHKHVDGYQVVAPGVASWTDAERAAEKRKEGAQRRRLMGAGFITLTAVTFAAWVYVDARRLAAEDAQGMVAVIPFQDRTGNPELERVRIGEVTADSMVAALIDTKAVRVVPPVSVMAYIPSEVAARGVTPAMALEVGRKTDATTVLTGTVSQVGESYAASAQLLRVTDGKVLKTFQSLNNAPGVGVLDVVQEVAAGVGDAFAASLESREKPELAPISTPNLQAYAEYVQGMRLHMGEGKYALAVEHYSRALELDPEFAMAWSELACAQALAGNQAESNRAGAEATKRASRLSKPMQHILYGNYAWGNDNNDEARGMYRRAVTLAPRDPAALMHYAAFLYYADHDVVAAIPVFEELLRNSPHFYPAYRELAEAYDGTGRTADAMALAEKYVTLVPEDARGHTLLGYQVLVPDPARARLEFEKALKLDPDYARAAKGLKRLEEMEATTLARNKAEPGAPVK